MLKLYIDEDSMENALVQGLNRLGFDVVTAEGADNRSLSDEEQPYRGEPSTRGTSRWHRDGRTHSGIILVTEHRVSIGRRLDAFAALVESRTVESLQNDLVFLLNYPRV